MGFPALASLLLIGAGLSACVPAPALTAPASAAAAFTARLGETANLGGRTITALSVLEDSRCPADVMCIQAGTAKILVRVQRGRKATNTVVGLDRPADVGGAWLHLGTVCPYPLASRPVSPADYRMVFVLSDSSTFTQGQAAAIACPSD
jgi:hypothetical protein